MCCCCQTEEELIRARLLHTTPIPEAISRSIETLPRITTELANILAKPIADAEQLTERTGELKTVHDLFQKSIVSEDDVGVQLATLTRDDQILVRDRYILEKQAIQNTILYLSNTYHSLQKNSEFLHVFKPLIRRIHIIAVQMLGKQFKRDQTK